MSRRGPLGVPLNSRLFARGVHDPMPYRPRVSHRPLQKRSKRPALAAHYEIRCGCCGKGKVQIFYGDFATQVFPDRATVEINGVDGYTGDWREILMPILGFEKRGNQWLDIIPGLLVPKPSSLPRYLAKAVADVKAGRVGPFPAGTTANEVLNAVLAGKHPPKKRK